MDKDDLKKFNKRWANVLLAPATLLDFVITNMSIVSKSCSVKDLERKEYNKKYYQKRKDDTVLKTYCKRCNKRTYKDREYCANCKKLLMQK